MDAVAAGSAAADAH